MSIQKALKDQFKKFIPPGLQKQAKKSFLLVKKDILEKVKNHNICRELTNKTIPSSFISAKDSSLFGFMGFNEGDDPVGSLIDFLDENITYNTTLKITAFTLISTLKLPSKEAMRRESSLQLPWIRGVSWPELVENGVPGLRYFLAKNDGRSGLGIQAKSSDGNLRTVRNENMAGVKFISEIFSAAKAQI